MKKIFALIFSTISIVAMGQNSQEQPLVSKNYNFTTATDSSYISQTIYEYTDDALLTAKATKTWATNVVDSFANSYTDGKIILCNEYIGGTLVGAESWHYNTVNSTIDYHYLRNMGGAALDSVMHTKYFGVKDFDVAGMEFDLSIIGFSTVELRDCDSIHIYMFDEGAWKLEIVSFPVFQNDAPKQIKLTMYDFDASLIIPDIVQKVTAEVTFLFSYSAAVLDSINGNMIVIMSPSVKIPINNIFKISYTYDSGILSEMKTEIKVKFSMLGINVNIDEGTKEAYLYDSQGNILCTSYFWRENSPTWNLNAKDWYFYSLDSIDDGPASSMDNLTKNHFNIYPNPTYDKLILNDLTEQVDITVYDIAGKFIIRQIASENNAIIDISPLPAGTYIVKIQTKNDTQSVKIIKQ